MTVGELLGTTGESSDDHDAGIGRTSWPVLDLHCCTRARAVSAVLDIVAREGKCVLLTGTGAHSSTTGLCWSEETKTTTNAGCQTIVGKNVAHTRTAVEAVLLEKGWLFFEVDVTGTGALWVRERFSEEVVSALSDGGES